MDFFVWGHLNEHVHLTPTRIIEDIVARIKAVLTTVDVNMLRHIGGNAVRRTAVCLGMDGGVFEYRR
jgi:hypothetical protein